ncbi:hypothetical protein CWB92_23125, partial [Pseudoalteromonas piscicida]
WHKSSPRKAAPTRGYVLRVGAILHREKVYKSSARKAAPTKGYISRVGAILHREMAHRIKRLRP